jgi:hypothetical protein
MKTDNTIEEQLWYFIDGTVSANEKTSIEQLLQSNQEWKSKYKELVEINKLLHSSELEAPSMRFTKTVMEKISSLHIAPATKSYINNRIIWGLGLFFITIITSFLIYGFSQVNWAAEKQSSFAKNIPKLDFTKFFNNNWVNGFMLINIILGLVLLDNYLTSKRKQFRNEV